MAWRVKFFQTARGRYPVRDFAREQNASTYAKIIHSIELLESFGPYLKPPYAKKLRNKLYELRISGKIAVRIFYTIIDNKFYLLHAFKKKTQRTPPRELKVAIDRMKELI